jgi:hypothetical protein
VTREHDRRRGRAYARLAAKGSGGCYSGIQSASRDNVRPRTGQLCAGALQLLPADLKDKYGAIRNILLCRAQASQQREPSSAMTTAAASAAPGGRFGAPLDASFSLSAVNASVSVRLPLPAPTPLDPPCLRSATPFQILLSHRSSARRMHYVGCPLPCVRQSWCRRCIGRASPGAGDS